MKDFLLHLFAFVFILCSYSCACMWSESPQCLTVTLDKYEAKPGDEITIDGGEYPIADCMEICTYIKGDNERYYLDFVRDIDSSKSIWKIPEKASSGKIEFYMEMIVEYGCDGKPISFRRDNISELYDGENSCTTRKFYGSGESDKPLTITQ